jgi:hypothetical protein
MPAKMLYKRPVAMAKVYVIQVVAHVGDAGQRQKASGARYFARRRDNRVLGTCRASGVRFPCLSPVTLRDELCAGHGWKDLGATLSTLIYVVHRKSQK